jgi:very-short-patch-repair endonuclease
MRRNFLYSPKLKMRARKLRNEMTIAEKKIWYECLANSKYRWLRQRPINNYIVDFYCPKLKLVIEVDGATHLREKDLIYDLKRIKDLEKLGLKVLRFWNNDVLSGPHIVGEIIDKEIKRMKSPHPPLLKGET